MHNGIDHGPAETIIGFVSQEHFTRLWTHAQPVLASYISSLVPEPSSAEDILQDVAVILLRKFAEYDSQRPFIAWAIGVAKMEMLSRRRDQARSRIRFSDDFIERVADVHQEVADELPERTRALRECLRGLGGRAREILDLHYRRSMSAQSIAELLKLNIPTIRMRLSRVRRHLYECIRLRISSIDGHSGTMELE